MHYSPIVRHDKDWSAGLLMPTSQLLCVAPQAISGLASVWSVPSVVWATECTEEAATR